ncbi:MAG: CHAT domain-containing protein [Flavobacteriales bacterium]|nr:CHAT domain-containing protein [Flavobacteriales bacterium]
MHTRILIFFLLTWTIYHAQDCELGAAASKIESLIKQGEFKGSRELCDSILDCNNLEIGSNSHIQIEVLNYNTLRGLNKRESPLRAINGLKESLQKINHPFLEDVEFKLMKAEAIQLRKHYNEVPVLLSEINIHNLSPSQLNRYEFIRTFNNISLEKVDAIPELQKLLEKFNEVGSPSVYHLGNTLAKLGQKCRNIGDFEKGLEYHKTEMELYEKNYSNEHEFVANAAYNIANNYYELEQFENALKYYLPCHAIWSRTKKRDDRYMRFLNEGIGDMYWELGNNKEALKYFNLSVIDEVPINNDTSIPFITEGDSLLQAGNYGDAFNYYEEALKMRETLYGKDHALTGSCQNYVARSMHSNGKDQEALSAYQNAICMLATNFSDTAIHANPVIDPNALNNNYLFESLVGKAELLKKQFFEKGNEEDLEIALETQKLALEIIDNYKYGAISKSSKAYWSKKSMPLFESLINTYLTRSQIKGEDHRHHCLEVVEKSKALLLLTSFYQTELADNSKVPKDILSQENELKEQINFYTGKISLEEQRCSQTRSKMLDLWSTELRVLQNEYDVFLSKLKLEYPDYYDLKFELPLAGLQNIQSDLLDENSAILEYFIGDNDIYTFVITKNDVEIINSPITRSHFDLLASYNRSIRDFARHQLEPAISYKEYCKDSYEIYQIFVEGAIQNLDENINNLIVIPDHDLSYLSFSSLLTKNTDHQKINYKDLDYLFKKYSISYAASSSLKLLAQNLNSSISKYQGFAPEYLEEELAFDGLNVTKLHFNNNEVEQGKTILGGNSWVGQNVTEELFVEHAREAGILHLASHAFINDQDPMLSKFMFNRSSENNGWLHTYEIYDLETKAQLIILSACNTGIGEWQRGEGMLSLERAFQYGGCPSLLTSLWTVDDGATSELSSLFLTHLKNGVTKDKALNNAMNSFLENSNPEKLHPFFWSSFKVVGNTDPLQEAKNYWTYVFLILVVLLGALVLKRKINPKSLRS